MQQTHCFEHVLVADTWLDNVKLTVSAVGNIVSLETNAAFTGADKIFRGWAIPGIPNVHSHAFQRLMRGFAEHSTSPNDSFWTWRETMYKVAQTLTPDDLKVVAAQLYIEMLKVGYTSVAEFHYLHHQPNGVPYADCAQMSLAIQEAASVTGIGLTHVPVLYMTSSFNAQPLQRQQRRFAHDIDAFQGLLQRLQQAFLKSPQQRLAVAMHSLRAVPHRAQHRLLEYIGAECAQTPIHIHIAEQLKEVDECVAAYGQRPVEWLLNEHDVGENWCLIHATHLQSREISALAKSGAVVGLCPTTEANLGDGVFPLAAYLQCQGRLAIGSDSHVSVSPIEEMRWLEYGQRLASLRRNIVSNAVSPTKFAHCGDQLLKVLLHGSAQAMGARVGAIAEGYRADIAVLDGAASDLAAVPRPYIVDRAIFAGNSNSVQHVMAGGQWVVENYQHQNEEKIKAEYLALQKRVTQGW